ncbi:hypothetical protein [Lutibacter sp. HS1-25]|uniref:hypothetical protein n=1 Tax=Lutibacter sp. HS1-25 TaxID=2485000 RepID=UPI00101096E1|nr:hypothetical protein [Lutibacter sp. HS1-25]
MKTMVGIFMKKLGYIFCILMVFNFQQIAAQETDKNCACCSVEYQQFDFWLGKWEVYDKDAVLIGVNSIIKMADNCLIQEKWIDDARRGSSTIFYNNADNTWNQIWVDNSDFILKLKGNLEGDIMTLKSDLITGVQLKYYNQITWTKNEDGSITQLWEIYDQNELKISDVFLGIYKKTLN